MAGAPQTAIKVAVENERSGPGGAAGRDVDRGLWMHVGVVALALGAVPVAARVIGDGLVPATETRITMTAEGCSAAADDSVHHLAVLKR